MFVDSSAIVAVLTAEEDADRLADRIEAADAPVTSAIAIFEAALGICRKRYATVEEARDDVRAFLEAAGIEVVSIAGAEAEAALLAFSRYGKGRGHPAQLNMGDCFAYAVARTRDLPLLYKGNDFSQTDIG
jgi:ribonuclease VapC